MKIKLLLSLLVIGVLAVGMSRAVTRQKTYSPEAVQRGDYLVNALAACGHCHTSLKDGKPDMDKLMAGGNEFKGKGVVIYARNLTPDPDTGLGKWKDKQIIRAIRDGINNKGDELLPPMPYGNYRMITDRDISAIVAYLRSLKPVVNKVPGHRELKANEASESFNSSANVRTVALHHEPQTRILAITDEHKGAVWMVQDSSKNISLLRNIPQVSMFEIQELSISPDDYFLVVISRGEGHPILEAFKLNDIFTSQDETEDRKIKPIAGIDPFPGDVSIANWQGRKLILESDVPLDKIERNYQSENRIGTDVEKECRFQWDIESKKIERTAN
jgi:mono/diheme cytochrome c family protein